MNKKLPFLFFLFCQFVFCQNAEEKLLHGKIMTSLGTVEGVNILNSTTKIGTSSNIDGEFYILVKVEDILILSSVNLKYYTKKIEETDLNHEVLIINMAYNTTELNEVVINKYPEINAVSLGISPSTVKKYTPAERKLYAASSTPVDALLNYMSGRTAMLKKGIEVEKKEYLLVKMDALFEDEYYIETLKIPKDYIKGFQYYCIENEDLAASLNAKNKLMTKFLIYPLAEKYKMTINTD